MTFREYITESTKSSKIVELQARIKKEQEHLAKARADKNKESEKHWIDAMLKTQEEMRVAQNYKPKKTKNAQVAPIVKMGRTNKINRV